MPQEINKIAYWFFSFSYLYLIIITTHPYDNQLSATRTFVKVMVRKVATHTVQLKQSYLCFPIFIICCELEPDGFTVNLQGYLIGTETIWLTLCVRSSSAKNVWNSHNKRNSEAADNRQCLVRSSLKRICARRNELHSNQSHSKRKKKWPWVQLVTWNTPTGGGGGGCVFFPGCRWSPGTSPHIK